MGPGSSGGSEGGAEFVVEEPETGVYNPSGVDPPVWQPAPHDILLMLDQLHKDQVLPLKWVCPGRRPPEADAPEQPLNDMSDGEEGEDGKEEEKRTPEPSAFDFDDTASEASAKVKITPRTPAQAKRPEKKVACMDNIISSLKRQQKAEREARKSQARSSLGGMTALRAGAGGGGGTPARVSGFSPSSSPHVSAAPSPSSGSPRGSPRVPAVVHSPSPRVVADSGETVTDKKPSPSPPTTTTTTASVGTASPSVAQGHGNDATSPPVKVSEASGTEEPPPPPPLPQSASSSCAGDSAPSVKAETEQAEASADPVVPMETDAAPSDSTAVKQEG